MNGRLGGSILADIYPSHISLFNLCDPTEEDKFRNEHIRHTKIGMVTYINVIYLDFRKAFDTVAHARLANKLYTYGIRGNMLNWIKSFFKDRKQKVMINDEGASWSGVLSGIPQGSVFGPALFLVFINDLFDSIANFVKIFADDQNQNNLLAKHQNDNTSPGDWPRKISP